MKYNIKRINENSIREFNAQTGRQEDALENEGAERHILFVYGSLMKGEYNHDAYMKNALFLGNASIDHFSLYDLGSYPGIRHSRRREKVLGELYEVDQDAYEAICRLEGNGFLYQSEPVTAEIMDGRGHMEAETFVYLDDVDRSKKIPEQDQPWNRERRNRMNYVWYACYGSNINSSRFMNYIDRCADTTPPAEDRPYEFDHPVYFAGKSITWDGYGKAFLDNTAAGHAYGRIYKITREQYLQVKKKEGPDYTRKVELGEIDHIPVVTFTCARRPERSVPSLPYLDTILEGLHETYPDCRESALAADLIAGIFSREELLLLNCLREAEHGLSNRKISETAGMAPEKEKEVILRLGDLGLVRQDRRSRQYGPQDDNAVYYTIKSERALIDRTRELANEAVEMRDIPADESLVTAVAAEGGRRQFLTTRYERRPENRAAAIRIHGTACQVCGFDFAEHYGTLGEDFIEVHHIRPLSTLEEEVTVDPETDLVCLCANCHRMIHRSRDHVMSVEELCRIYRP